MNLVHKSKIFFCLSIFTIGLISLSACNKISDGKVEVEPVKQEATINFLYSDWPPDLIVYLAKEKGFFEKNNVNINLVKVSGLEELIEKKKSKSIAYAWGYTLFETLLEKAKGNEDEQILFVQDYSAGADAVLARADSTIKNISDLRGKIVGVETGTVGEFFLSILLERENLKLSDLTIVNLNSEEIPSALTSNKIEAGVAYEPDVSTALDQGAMVITDSKQERGVIVDVYVGKKEHIETNQEAYQNFALSVFEAIDFYKENQEEALNIMSQPYSMDPKELEEIFNAFQLPDLRENQTALNRSSGFNSLYNLAKKAEQFLIDEEMIEGPLDFDSLFENNLLDNLKIENI